MSGQEVNSVHQKVMGILANAKSPRPNLPMTLFCLEETTHERGHILADKGRCTMVLDKDTYNEKIMTLLEDSTTYRKLKKDPTTTAENKMNEMLLGLKKKGILAEALYKRLRSSGGHVPLFYGLPKVHKTGVPLRPIVSFISSLTCALSKFLAKVSSLLVGKTESFVASSSDFVNYTKSLRIPQGYTLLSFDVISLFMKVPTDLAVEVIGRRLE